MEIAAYAINEPGGTAEPFVYETLLGSGDVLVKITHRSLARVSRMRRRAVVRAAGVRDLRRGRKRE